VNIPDMILAYCIYIWEEHAMVMTVFICLLIGFIAGRLSHFLPGAREREDGEI
jgi:hypothetical protein